MGDPGQIKPGEAQRREQRNNRMLLGRLAMVREDRITLLARRDGILDSLKALDDEEAEIKRELDSRGVVVPIDQSQPKFDPGAFIAHGLRSSQEEKNYFKFPVEIDDQFNEKGHRRGTPIHFPPPPEGDDRDEGGLTK